MWLHIVIFVIIFSLAAGKKLGWIKVEAYGTARGRKLFMLVSLCGNAAGMLLTVTQGSSQTYSQGHELRKEEYSYEEKFLVSVEGEETGSVYVQVPEKEMEEEKTEQLTVLTEEEQRKQKLMEMLEKYNEQKSDTEYYYLPANWNGKKIEWTVPGDSTGNMLAGMSVLTALVLIVMTAREEQQKKVKRYEELMLDYPGLILKFSLLVQAGMTVRNAFRKIAVDYKKGKRKKLVYEEIVMACHEMESGIPELETYRRFGERCGHVKYKTFSTLLIQNLQKGSRQMSELLEKESVEAWDDRKRKAKVMGEAAATRLLFPMILMLMVVMAIIMLPAVLSFYG